MKTNKTATFTAAVVLTAATVATSCTGKKQGMVFDSYEYDGVAMLNLDSTYTDLDTIYVRTSGHGVMPVAIGDADITLLRDSLQRMAGVVIDAKGNARAGATAEYTPLAPEAAKGSDAEDSFASNDLTVAYISPAVMVWRSYYSGYVEGAAHGRYATTFLNYSIADNKILGIADLMRAGYEEELLGMLRDKLKGNRDLIVSLDQVEIPANFEITPEGINFIYGIYEVAPYSSGEIVVDFAFYELSDMLTSAAFEMLTGQKSDESGADGSTDGK